MAINDMLSMPAYTDEMFQQGQTSMIPGQSLFKPSQLSLPGPAEQAREPQYAGMPDDMYSQMLADQQREQAFQQQNPGMPMMRTAVIRPYEQWMMDNPYTPPQQQPSPYGGMTPGDALGGGLTMQKPTPVQQLNSPSLEQIAQTPPPSTGPRMVNGQFVDSVFGHPLLPHELTADMRAQMAAYQPSVPMMTQPPETQQVVAQIQAPVTNMPTTPVPVPQAPPQTQQLLRQIAAPVMTRTAPRPQQPAMSMRAPAPVQTDRLAPIRQSLAQLRPLRTQQPAVQPRRPAPISRVQPRLLPTPPMGRR